MARRVKIKWKPGVFAEIRTLDSTANEVERLADELAAEANTIAPRPAALYRTDFDITGGRVRGRSAVFTGNLDAVIDNAKHKTLMRVFASKGGLVEYTSKAGRTSWITQKQYDNYTRNRRG